MSIMTYEYLEQLMATVEGVSVNGSEGLGGHGKGFDIQNGGVTRRNPGEGPKVNGGRAQSQELDSYDQPQYESEEVDAVPDRNEDPSGWYDYMANKFWQETGFMAPGKDMSMAMGGGYDEQHELLAAKAWKDFLSQHLSEGPEERFTVGPENNEEVCPVCNGNGVDTECFACDGTGTFEGYLNKFQQDFPYDADFQLDNDVYSTEPQNEEAPWMGSNDPEGWERQVSMGTNTRDQGVRDDVSIKEMFAFEVKDVPDRMKKVHADMAKLKKSSEKEKKEHPWATKKQATQIAQDHEKLGEQLKRTIIIKESPDVLKPGDCYMAVQFIQLDGIHCDDPRLRGAGYKCHPGDAPIKGYVQYTVQPDGTLMTTSANWDSSD